MKQKREEGEGFIMKKKKEAQKQCDSRPAAFCGCRNVCCAVGSIADWDSGAAAGVG